MSDVCLFFFRFRFPAGRLGLDSVFSVFFFRKLSASSSVSTIVLHLTLLTYLEVLLVNFFSNSSSSTSVETLSSL